VTSASEVEEKGCEIVTDAGMPESQQKVSESTGKIEQTCRSLLASRRMNFHPFPRRVNFNHG